MREGEDHSAGHPRGAARACGAIDLAQQPGVKTASVSATLVWYSIGKAPELASEPHVLSSMQALSSANRANAQPFG
jgi:hypothetical protein